MSAARSTPPLDSVPASPTAIELLRSLYRHPGPYTSVYLPTQPVDPAHTLEQRWLQLRRELADRGAPAEGLDAIAARLALPAPEDTAGMCVIASADGHTIVDHGLEPPRTDFIHVDSLPYVAPLLEWDQRRIPHLVVTIDQNGADVIAFGVDHRTAISTTTLVGTPDELVPGLAASVDAIDAGLVVVAGDRDLCHDLARNLTGSVDVTCQVIVDDSESADDLADATVRYVIDTAARATVDYLREFRFLASHEAAVDGTAASIDALASGVPDLLLIHDDPTDERRIWIGDDPRLLSVEARPGTEIEARFIDAAIRSAVAQDIAVHIIPSTGPAGPNDGIAALNRTV